MQLSVTVYIGHPEAESPAGHHVDLIMNQGREDKKNKKKTRRSECSKHNKYLSKQYGGLFHPEESAGNHN